MEQQRPILQMTDIHKQFPGVKALSNVQFRLFPGEVHALMGENGAGKSTLIKVLTGVYENDQGTVELEGRTISLQSPQNAVELGISTVYQEVNLCPNLSVAENIFIGREPRRYGRILWKEINRRASQLLKERLQLQIDVTKPLHSYSVAIQQLIAIARALDVSAKVLILDEPTSSLDQNEVKQLFQIMNQLKNEGLAILFVTHFLDQVYEMSDRITILRNGEFVGEYLAKDLPRIDLVSKMIGKELHMLEDIPKTTEGRMGMDEVLIEATALGRQGAIAPFSLQIAKGEVVGLAGLLGSGRTELARLFFGADRTDQGELKLGDVGGTVQSPKQAIDQGIAFCSENRKTEGIIENLTVRENIILALQANRGLFRTIPRKKQDEIAEEYIKKLNIKPSNPEHLVKNLSGGNQQKVILARWLIMQPKLLILDEPTRGIDVGTKAEIQKLVISLSREQQMSFLFISSELEEVVRVSDRIAILRDRKKIQEMNGQEISQHNVLKAIAGGNITHG